MNRNTAECSLTLAMCGAAGPALAPGSAFGKARLALTGHTAGAQSRAAHIKQRPGRKLVFLATDHPVRGHRLNGGLAAVRLRRPLTRRPLNRIMASARKTDQTKAITPVTAADCADAPP
jgi:hypothetical protein